MERLQKFLSRAGVASRRHAETMITDGRVKVNGKTVTELGTRVDPQKDLVLLDGKLVSASSERKYFLLYKPPGVVTTLSDPEGRPTVADYSREAGGRVFPVGRLDYDAEGALILTDDGELANKLMHPSHQVPRVYLAKVKGVPDEPSLAKLVEGVRLEDGMAKAVEAKIFNHAQRNTWVKLVVTEGRQHLVKRLCAAIGHPVVRLFRPAHAGISVHGLRPGEMRALSNDEVRRVKAAADGDVQPQPSLYLPGRRHGHAAPGFEPDDDDEGEEQTPVAPPEPKSGRFGARDAIAGYEMKPLRLREPRGGGFDPPKRKQRDFGDEGFVVGAADGFIEAEGGETESGGSEASNESGFGKRGGSTGSRGERASGGGRDGSRRAFGNRDSSSRGGSRGENFGGASRGTRGGRDPGSRSGGFGQRDSRDDFGKREPGAFGSREGGGKRAPGAFGSRDGGGKREPGAFGSSREGGKRERGGFGSRDGSAKRGKFGKREPGAFAPRDRGGSSDRRGFDKRDDSGGRPGRFGKRPDDRGGRSGVRTTGRFAPKTGAGQRSGPRTGGRSSPRKPRGSW